jgi:hypothetical protein
MKEKRAVGSVEINESIEKSYLIRRNVLWNLY